MTEILCANFKPDSCAATGQKTICRGMEDSCEFPGLYKPNAIVALEQTLNLEYVEQRIAVEDRTLSFLYREIEVLKADRHFWIEARKSLMKGDNGTGS